jgi:4-amino-4-deoxy-L-arabinose transferase-like glycosyltransferase
MDGQAVRDAAAMSMSRLQFGGAVAVIALVTVFRIAATHAVFSPTYDEPVHVAAGYQYWTEHQYTTDRAHPPLARIVFAWPLRHAQLTGSDGFDRAGQMFASAGDYMRGVVAARRGNLLFVVLAIIGIALWTVQVMGRAEAVIAAAIFALLPPVLAHGGLATTDMAGVAGIALGMAAMQWWIAAPSWPRTALLALAVGVGLLTKMSFPIFFAIGAIALMTVEKKWPVGKGVAAILGSFVVLDAGYFFSKPALYFKGFRDLMAQNTSGFDSYFMGHVSSMGSLAYFPVLMAIKTPLPALLLMLAGIIVAVWTKQHRALTLILAFMLALVMMSSINRGIRHVLPIYVLLVMFAAFAATTLWSTRMRWLLPILGAWLIVNSALAHPEYLPWTNALAGRHPERIALDSNFDWGQDALRLRDECRRRGIGSVHVALFGMVDLPRLGMPPVQPIDPMRGAPGWYAISESIVLPAQARNREAYRWLTEGREFIRVGKTIRLYRV